MRTALLLVLGAGLLALGGCVRHHHHHHHTAESLDNEHKDTKIVVVNKQPGPDRVCWRHGRHWHCRRP